MRDVKQQEIVEITCDATGKKLRQGQESISLEIPVLFANKENLKEMGEGAWEVEYVNLDLLPEIGFEILMFLKKKYGKISSKLESDLVCKLNNCKILPYQNRNY